MDPQSECGDGRTAGNRSLKPYSSFRVKKENHIQLNRYPMKKISIILSLVFLLTLPSHLLAQFEGVISFTLIDLDNPVEESRFEITASGQRLFIKSGNEVNVMRGLDTNGLLVRSDLSDFVFMSEENTALQIKKSDIDGLMSMLGASGNNSNGQNFDWENRIVSTGNQKKLAGYDAEEYVLNGEEGESISVWLTEEIKVDWGLLNDVWHSSGSGFFGEDVPIELVMNNNSFPMLIEFKKDGEVKARASVASVSTSYFNKNILEIPSNAEMIGLTDIMMNMFRQ